MLNLGAHKMIRQLRNLVRNLRRDERGVSAVEFAMLCPLMLTMYFGTIEVSQGISIDRKLTLTARTVTDLASQVTTINNADMTNLLKASQAVISPYPTDKLAVTVSLVKTTPTARRRSTGATRSAAPLAPRARP